MQDNKGNEVPLCEKCKQYHLTPRGGISCPGHISINHKRAGGPCLQPQGLGTPSDVGLCKYHGGCSPHGVKKAEKDKLEIEVKRQLGLTDWDPIVDPYSALADHAGKGVALETILHHKVEELASLRQYGGEMGDRIDVIYEAWERAYSRIGNELIAMARLDLDDRISRLQAKIDDATADLVREAMTEATAHLLPEVRDDVLVRFGKSLRRGEVVQEGVVRPEVPELPSRSMGRPGNEGIDNATGPI